MMGEEVLGERGGVWGNIECCELLRKNEGFALEVGIILTPPFSLFISG